MDPAEERPGLTGISVVLCTYNGERFLRQQLESLFAQQRTPDELIAVDDTSSDGTLDILNEFQRRSFEVGIHMVVVRNPRNLGYRRNFEAALALAQMPLIFLSDQDDVWHHNKIARMEAEFAERPQLLLLHTDARLVDADGVDLGYGLFEALEISSDELACIHGGQALQVLLRRNVATGATMAFRRRALEDAFPFPDLWIHDEWLALVGAINGEVDCLEEMLIDYRQHGGNQIGVRKRSLGEKFGGHGVSRRDHLRDVEVRLRQLHARLTGDGRVFESRQDLLFQRLRHVQARLNLPSSLAARARWVLCEAQTGRYSRFSFGLRSIVADLLGLK